MHNGLVAGYQRLLPMLVEELCRYPTAFRVAVEHGLIDSAVAFAYLLVKLGVGHLSKDEIAVREFRPDELLTATAAMINHLCAMVEENNIADDSLLNFVVADGTCIIACRYAHPGASQAQPSSGDAVTSQTGGTESPPFTGGEHCGEHLEPTPPAETAQATLYLTTGTQWAVAPHDKSGRYRMLQADKRSRMAIISSEPLTSVKDEWLPIPRDTFVVCTRAFDLEGSGNARKAMATVDVFLVPFGDAAEPSQLAWPEHSLPRDAWGPSLSSLLRVSSQSSLQKANSDSPSSSPRSDAGRGHFRDGKIWSSFDGEEGMEVMTSEHSGIDEAPVLCIAAVPPHGVLAVGCSDGGLRFFSMSETAEREGGPEIRHHTGPIFSLLVSVEQEGAVRTACNDEPRIDDLQVTRPDVLLFSASPNELRMWDVTPLRQTGVGPWPDLVCMFCFKFQPNPGKVLSLTGDVERLFLGFQSGKVLSLKLAQHWAELVPSRRSKDTRDKYRMRTVTFDLGKATISVRSFLSAAADHAAGEDGCRPGRQRMKALYHSITSDLGSPHCGGIHGIAYHRTRQILVTAGSDGLLIFWSRSNPEAPVKGRSDMAKVASWPDTGMPLEMLAERLHRGNDCGKGVPEVGMHKSSSTREPSPGVQSSACHARGPWLASAKYPGGRPILSMVLDQDSEEVFVGDASGRIQVWGLCSAILGAGMKAALGPRLQATVLALQLIPNPCVAATNSRERWLLSGDTDGRICLWDVTRSVLIEAFNGLKVDCASAVCWFAGGEGSSPLQVAFAGSVGGVHIFGGDAKGVLHSMTMHNQTLQGRSVALSRRVNHSDEFALIKAYLQRLVAIPSTFDRPDEKRRAGAWLSDHFEKLIGASVRVCSDGTVLARCGWDPDRPLFVLYSHYDVVPAGDGWSADPWTLQGKDGYLIGRGTTDCKGPILAQMFAVRQLQQELWATAATRMSRQFSGASTDASEKEDFVLTGLDTIQPESTDLSSGLPFNLLFVVDACEEVGSPHLFGAIKEAREHGWLGTSQEAGVDIAQARCGGAPIGLLVSNSTWIDDVHPCICYGMRGLLDVQVCVTTGGSRDIHTAHAGLLPEPFFDLSALLGSLVDASGRIQVPGFASKVQPLAEAERANFEKVVEAVGEVRLQEKLNKSLGFGANTGTLSQCTEQSSDAAQPSSRIAYCALSATEFKHAGVEALKLMWSLPSLSVLSVSSGLPSTCGRLIAKEATAVISVRTVPGQDAVELVQCLQAHLDFEFAKRRSGNLLKVTPLCAFRSWECPIVGPDTALLFRAARRGVQQAWELQHEEDVLAIREGSSIPALTSLQAELGCEAIQVPLGQASDAPHLPDERISEKNLARGVQAIYHTLMNLAELLNDRANVTRIKAEQMRRLNARPSEGLELFCNSDSAPKLPRASALGSTGSPVPPVPPLADVVRRSHYGTSDARRLPETNPWSPRRPVHYMCQSGHCSLCIAKR